VYVLDQEGGREEGRKEEGDAKPAKLAVLAGDTDCD
jgi:hypothetical protein